MASQFQKGARLLPEIIVESVEITTLSPEQPPYTGTGFQAGGMGGGPGRFGDGSYGTTGQFSSNGGLPKHGSAFQAGGMGGGPGRFGDGSYGTTGQFSSNGGIGGPKGGFAAMGGEQFSSNGGIGGPKGGFAAMGGEQFNVGGVQPGGGRYAAMGGEQFGDLQGIPGQFGDGSYETTFTTPVPRAGFTTRVTLSANDIKNLITNNGFSWMNKDFGAHSLSKYLKAKIIQCVDPEVTNVLTDNPQMIEAMTNGVKNISPRNEHQRQIQGSDMQVKIIPLIDNSEGYTDLMPPAPPVVAVRGSNVISKKTYEVEFNNVPDTGHVSYFAHVFLDTEEMFQDHNLNLANPSNIISTGLTTGKVDSCRILENNVVTGKRVTYQTSEDEGHSHFYTLTSPDSGIAQRACHPTFPRVCHEHIIKDGRVMPAGSKHIDPVNGVPDHTHQLLTPRKGVTIYDNTKVDQLKKVEIASEPIPEVFEKLPEINMKTYISPGYFSRDKCNHYHGFFAIDMRKIAVYESRFNEIHSRNTNFLGNLHIRELKIFRQRAAESNESDRLGVAHNIPVTRGGSGEDSKKMDLSERVLIAELRTSSPNNPGAVEELSDIYTEFGNNNLKYFNFIDTSMGSVADGHYLYSVEINLVDTTASTLSAGLKRLQSLRREVESYLKNLEALQAGRLSVADRPSLNVNVNVWINQIMLSYKTFGAELGSGADRSRTIKALKTQLSLKTANQAGVRNFVEIINNFIKKVNALVAAAPRGESVTASGRQTARPIKVSGKNGNKNGIKITKVFKTSIDGTIPLGTGYEYLCINETCNPPSRGARLGSISATEYKDRVAAEANKYFGSDLTDTSIKLQNVDENFFNPSTGAVKAGGANSVSYLAPCTVYVKPDEPIDILTDQEPNNYLNLEVLVLTKNNYNNFCRPRPIPPPAHISNLAAAPGQQPNAAQPMASSILEMLSSMKSLSVEPGNAIEQTMFMCSAANNSTTEQALSDAKDYTDLAPKDLLTGDAADGALAKTAEMDKIKIAAADILMPALDTFVYNGFKDSSGTFTRNHPDVYKGANDASKWEMSNEQNAIMQLIKLRKRQNVLDDDIQAEISGLPDQVKSLFNRVGTKTDNMQLDRSSFNFKFRMIMSVSYLAGFNSINGPVFKRLTTRVLEDAINTRKSLVCRMMPWQNPHFGIIPVRGLELSAYHEIFVITSGTRSSRGTTTTTSTRRTAAPSAPGATRGRGQGGSY